MVARSYSSYGIKLLKALSTRSPMHGNLTLLPKRVFNLAFQMNLYILADAEFSGRVAMLLACDYGCSTFGI
jgi:hypothetical protein